ncbi:hypothetical protein [Mesorhizobium sp. STM 4661]|uniref:hypothetical protein n=1 Tax=Mesorhizobium sp. STM 4661 TaxID=1297570 RepID=UPI0002BD4119|nr:hypothetical protein [Mesorhizobium sp. STM 4661]CCV11272.1 conserved hypothetical protein [Mesorhizobium sp. STM 4661]
MPVNWRIEVEWEALQSAPAEEQACFGAIGISVNNLWLTEGHDYLANRLRAKPYLSGYHLAEWFAWNWWRLRWEPRALSREWGQTHCMSSIGQGYIWPNITIFSDGERTTLVSAPTAERAEIPFRYISGYAAVLPAGQFEAGLDEFFSQILHRLEAQGVSGTNFHSIFESLEEERSSPQLSTRRKFEALLGEDPDEADPIILTQLLADAEEASADSIQEVAATRAQTGATPALKDLIALAQMKGFDASSRDAVRLRDHAGLTPSESVPAWLLGARAARALRDQERLNGHPISDIELAALAGTTPNALVPAQDRLADFSFMVDSQKETSRLILRSKWHEGRRFELARLLGDRLLAPRSNRLFPATRAYTYRQKMQRAFAAELLSPFDEVETILQGDYSSEGQRDAAEHFDVSPLMIRTLLVNHHRIPSEELSDDFDAVSTVA